jgi:hypothetical protein
MMDFQFYVEHVSVSSSATDALKNAFLHHRLSLVEGGACASCNSHWKHADSTRQFFAFPILSAS